MSEHEAQIVTEVVGIATVITINRPKQYNAMNWHHYAAWEEAIKRAGDNPDTHVTILQSSGEYFSAGADVRDPSAMFIHDKEIGEIDWETRRNLQGQFAGRNVLIADTLWNHPKVLVCALNGPVVGLTAALIATADFVYARDNATFLVPFANLSLVTEGCAAYLLPQRLGLSLANEALLLSTPIKATDLYRVGFINELFPAKSLTTEEFNKAVLEKVLYKFSKLDFESVRLIKELVHAPYNQAFGETSAKEAIGGLNRFARGLPQDRFVRLASGSHRHKL